MIFDRPLVAMFENLALASGADVPADLNIWNRRRNCYRKETNKRGRAHP
jgi:hypothetical protein